jgi:hypothetical protein
MSNPMNTVELKDLKRGDQVTVRVHRRYGEEAECADSWTAYVWDVDVENDQIAIVHNDPETITDPTPTCRLIDRLGSNPEGKIDPAYTPTEVSLCGLAGRDGSFYAKIVNSQSDRMDQLLSQAKFSYADDREELASQLIQQLSELSEND